MQKSIIERVFPKPKSPLLPQYDESSRYHDNDRSASRGQVRLDSTASNSRASIRSNESSSKSKLLATPLSASVIHHEDPFITVDRAAQALQKTIQSLLDFQSQALSGRHQAAQDENTSQRSSTPTRSKAGSEHHMIESGVMPVRQPQKKKITLRGARRGLAKAMQEFSTLKEEELRITEDERAHRLSALDRVSSLETKREAIQHEMQTLRDRATENGATDLRSEAHTVEQEIHELEGRLMELKTRHRHLVDRAEQVESTAAAEMSSFEGTLNLIDKEIRSFLRRPPVTHGLSPRDLSNERHDMYALRSERRTLQMAREQWSQELKTLDSHKDEVELEKAALINGARLWGETVQRIDLFEQHLRNSIRSAHTIPDILQSLDENLRFLAGQLQQAEAKDWKLLVCATGAELEAFKQARALLAPEAGELEPESTFLNETANDTHPVQHRADEEDSDVPHADLLGAHSPELTSVDHEVSNTRNILEQNGRQPEHDDGQSSSSNESLKATLKSLEQDSMHASGSRLSSSTRGRSVGMPARDNVAYSESDDDDPGPHFLVSN